MINFRSFSGLYFLAFGLNTERYGACHRIQSKCGKYGPENSEYRYFSCSEMPRHFRIFSFPEIARFQKFRLIKIPENPKAKVQCCSSRSSRFQGKDFNLKILILSFISLSLDRTHVDNSDIYNFILLYILLKCFYPV